MNKKQSKNNHETMNVRLEAAASQPYGFIEEKRMPKISLMSARISLWLVGLFILLAFAGGVMAGTGGQFLSGSGNSAIAQGLEVTATSTTVKGAGEPATTTSSSTADLPEYLKKDADFKLFWQVWSIIKDKYYNKEIPDTQLFYGALQGLVASLGDPYSVFMTPTDSNQFQQDLKGNFEGIGAEIGLKNGNLIVVSPLPDTPAERAGLKPKDYILKINGTSTKGMNTNTAVSLIRGKKGTEVTLTIYREGSGGEKDYKIVRDSITVKSVNWELKNDDTALIKVRQFNEDTIPLFDKTIGEIQNNKKITKIILDLRGNPGGYLQSAIDMGGEWVGNQIVVSEKLRTGEQINHVSNRYPRLANYRTIVLVDGGSASASEIVSGALQDWGKAKLVGTKTFGKGSVQDLIDLNDGSSVKVTIAKWFTPKGRTIDETGIEPDYKVELTPEDYDKDKDPQLDRALELLK